MLAAPQIIPPTQLQYIAKLPNSYGPGELFLFGLIDESTRKMNDKKRGRRSKAAGAKMLQKQTFLSFSNGKLLATKRPTSSPIMSPDKSRQSPPVKKMPKKSPKKSVIKSTPKNLLPTSLASSSCQATVVPETPESDMSSSSIPTPLPKDTKERSGSGSSSDTDYQTPPEGPVEIPTVVKRESFMSKLNLTVRDKFEGPSFDLEQSSDIPTNRRSTQDVITISSDDGSCGGREDTTLQPSDNSVIITSDADTSPVHNNHQLRYFNCRIIDSTPLDRRKKRSVEGRDTGSPKRKTTKKEDAVKQEILMKGNEITSTPCKSIPKPSTPQKAALVRKALRKTTPHKRSTLKTTPSKVIPEASFDSPVSANRNNNIEYYFSSPAMADSPLSPARKLSNESVLSSPLKARRYQHTTDLTSMSLSSAQDLSSDGLFSSPTKHRPLRTVSDKSSPDSQKSPDSDDGLFDSDCPGSTSYFDGFDMDSESDPELKVSYNAVDVKQRAEDRLAEILKEVKQTSSSTTPRGGSNEPEDEVAVKYQAAKLKEAERIQQHQEKKEAYYKKLDEEEEARRKQQLMDAPLVQCETAGVEVFSYDTESIGVLPDHKLLRVMNEASLKPSQVLPRQAVDLQFNTVDVEWLLVKLARETSSVERQHIVPHLQKADIMLTRDNIEKVMKAIGLRYWDKRKGSFENKASAYSVLNKNRRTESMPCTPVKPKLPGRLASNNPITPVKALRMDTPFSPFSSFDSPTSFSMSTPSKTFKTPHPPPPFRYRSAESLSDFFDTMAQLIEPDCIDFLFRLLLLVSSDSSLDSLQSDTSPAYAGMARLLAKDEFTVEQALELVCDTVDLKSAQSRVLQALFCGTDSTMIELAHSCASVFFLREYIQDKTASELASLCSTDRSILNTTFLDNLMDFSHHSEKPSSFIRHMFGFFAQTMDPTSVKTWRPELKRKADSALKSRSDFVDNLDDFKFNALVMSWLTRVSTEFIVVEPALSAASF
jgi:hypothetical protein